jgi:hypothetical protein
MKFIDKNCDKIYTAIGIAERRIYVLSGKLLEDAKKDNVFPISPLDAITDVIHDIFAEDAKPHDFTKNTWFRPLHKKMQHLKADDLQNAVNEILAQLE